MPWRQAVSRHPGCYSPLITSTGTGSATPPASSDASTCATLRGRSGSFTPHCGTSQVYHGYERDVDGVYCRRRLRAVINLPGSSASGNFVARLHHPSIVEPSHRNRRALCALFRQPPVQLRGTGKRLRSGCDGAGHPARSFKEHRGRPAQGGRICPSTWRVVMFSPGANSPPSWLPPGGGRSALISIPSSSRTRRAEYG